MFYPNVNAIDVYFYTAKKNKKGQTLIIRYPYTGKVVLKIFLGKKKIDNNIFNSLIKSISFSLLRFKMRINVTYQNITIIIRATGIILFPLLSRVGIRKKITGLIM